MFSCSDVLELGKMNSTRVGFHLFYYYDSTAFSLSCWKVEWPDLARIVWAKNNLGRRWMEWEKRMYLFITFTSSLNKTKQDALDWIPSYKVYTTNINNSNNIPTRKKRKKTEQTRPDTSFLIFNPFPSSNAGAGKESRGGDFRPFFKNEKNWR